MQIRNLHFSVPENPDALIEQIPDSSLTASSTYGEFARQSPARSRFAVVQIDYYEGGWSAGQADANQWIQAEFSSVKAVFKVATKGRNGVHAQWVTKYQLKYNLSISEADFKYVTSAGGDITTFDGNIDQDSVVENEFEVISARIFRLCPIAWNYHIAMRWELYGY